MTKKVEQEIYSTFKLIENFLMPGLVELEAANPVPAALGDDDSLLIKTDPKNKQSYIWLHDELYVVGSLQNKIRRFIPTPANQADYLQLKAVLSEIKPYVKSATGTDLKCIKEVEYFRSRGQDSYIRALLIQSGRFKSHVQKLKELERVVIQEMAGAARIPSGEQAVHYFNDQREFFNPEAKAFFSIKSKAPATGIMLLVNNLVSLYEARDKTIYKKQLGILQKNLIEHGDSRICDQAREIQSLDKKQKQRNAFIKVAFGTTIVSHPLIRLRGPMEPDNLPYFDLGLKLTILAVFILILIYALLTYIMHLSRERGLKQQIEQQTRSLELVDALNSDFIELDSEQQTAVAVADATDFQQPQTNLTSGAYTFFCYKDLDKLPGKGDRKNSRDQNTAELDQQRTNVARCLRNFFAVRDPMPAQQPGNSSQLQLA